MESVNCNLCASDSNELLFQATDTQFQLPGVFNIVRCRNCGLVYVNPRPGPEEIGSYYPDEQYYACQPMSSGGLRSRIKRLVLESRPGYNRQISGRRKAAGRILSVLFSWQIDVQVPYVPEGKILDVGCGNGQLTSWMTGFGWDVYCNDTAAAACREAEKAGLHTHCGTLESAQYATGFFDVVVANHALEHVHGPLELLRECHRILKPGGLIIIDLPNFGCYDAGLFGPYWSALQAPTHLYHFTKPTLARAVETAGFEIDHWKLGLPLPLFDKVSLMFERASKRGWRERRRDPCQGRTDQAAVASDSRQRQGGNLCKSDGLRDQKMNRKFGPLPASH